MVETAEISVQIHKKSQCIYNNTVKNERNNLISLISNLKSVRQKINDVLTSLVQDDQSTNQGNDFLNLFL